jgi:predicted nucleic acid-binding protein
MNALDTNVWIYLHDTRDPRKQRIARQLIDTVAEVILPWQVGCEFISASKKIPAFVDEQEVWDHLADKRKAAALIAFPEAADWDEARELQATEMPAFWDALLIAVCVRCGATTLYTEDMGSPRNIRGLELINPFA